MKKNLAYRLISAAVMITIIVIAIFFSFELFCLSLLIIYLGTITELFAIIKPFQIENSLANKSSDIIIALCFITTATVSLLALKLLHGSNLILFWYALVISSYDSFAMLGGKLIRGAKLAEKISPDKTWSGFISGILGSIVIVSILDIFIGFTSINNYTIFKQGLVFPTLVIGILAQAGDLLESYLKRKYSCKDSGTIIPGHGGMLDRFDSNVLAAPALLIMMLIT